MYTLGMKKTIKTLLIFSVLFAAENLLAKESAIAALTDKTYTQVTKSKTPVLVKFWAPWCGSCKKIAPHYKKSAKSFNGKVKFTSVNVDDYYDFAKAKGIESVPTLILYKNGKEIDRTKGSKSKKEIDSWVKKHKI
jgi:thioredoxin